MSVDLLKQIDDLVASKTSNLDALDGIKKLKDDLGKTLAELDQAKAELKQARADNMTINGKLADAEKQIVMQKEFISGNAETVNKGQQAIYAAEKHRAVAEAWQSAMAMVFKPNAVRESVQRNHTVVVPNGSGSGYTTSVQNQDHIVREDA